MEIGNNIKKEFSFFDKSIKKESSKCYKLFAHHNINSFSYSIFDIEKQEFLSLESYISDKPIINGLKYLIQNKKIFHWDLESVSINYFLKTCTLFPAALFDEKMKKKYLELNIGLEESEEIFIDELKHISCVIIYSIPKSHLNILKNTENIKIKHSATVFLENILAKTKHSNENEVFIDVSTNNFNIAYVKSSKLIFYNNFSFSTKNDFLYYTLNCFNTLNLNSKSTILHISGEFNKSEILNDLKKYIKLVVVENRPDSCLYSHLFNTIPNHYFHKLFNQLKCE